MNKVLSIVVWLDNMLNHVLHWLLHDFFNWHVYWLLNCFVDDGLRWRIENSWDHLVFCDLGWRRIDRGDSIGIQWINFLEGCILILLLVDVGGCGWHLILCPRLVGIVSITWGWVDTFSARVRGGLVPWNIKLPDDIVNVPITDDIIVLLCATINEFDAIDTFVRD